MLHRSLATLPFAGILLGLVFFNRVTPMIFGLPLILAWLVLWIVLTSVIMAVIHWLDAPHRRRAGEQAR